MPDKPTDITYPRCSYPDCVNVYDRGVYFNINASKQQAGVTNQPDWRCIGHIPKDITYPQGLHGDEWILAGREPMKNDGR